MTTLFFSLDRGCGLEDEKIDTSLYRLKNNDWDAIDDRRISAGHGGGKALHDSTSKVWGAMRKSPTLRLSFPARPATAQYLVICGAHHGFMVSLNR
jgi:hypothetical protein